MVVVSLVILPSGDCHGTSLVISHHCFMWWLGVVRQQAITWANVDKPLCRHVTSLGHNELIVRDNVSGTVTPFHSQSDMVLGEVWQNSRQIGPKTYNFVLNYLVPSDAKVGTGNKSITWLLTGALCHKVISSRDIDFVWKIGACFLWDRYI